MLPPPDESISPLENAWEDIRKQMLDKKPRSVSELVKAQVMFYVGARTVITLAAASPMTLPLMAMEIREFQRAMQQSLSDQEAQCHPVSIS